MKKKKRGKKLVIRSTKETLILLLSILFSFFILQGVLALLPELTGMVMLIVGIIGLIVLGVWRLNKK